MTAPNPLPDQLPTQVEKMKHLASRLEDPQQVIRLLRRLGYGQYGWAPRRVGQKNQLRRLHETIARHIPCPTPELQVWMQDQFHLEAGLASNPNMDEGRAHHLLQQAWKTTETAGFQDDGEGTGPLMLEDRFFWGCDVLKAWDHYRRPLPTHFQEAIFWSVIRDGQLDLRLTRPPEGNDKKLETYLARKRQVKRFRLVGQHIRKGDREVFREIQNRIKDHPSSALQMITLPVAPKPFARKLAFHQQEPGTINAALEQFPELVDDDDFYEMAQSLKDPFVHTFLLEQINNPRQAETLMMELIDINPGIAATSLKDFRNIPGTRFRPELLSRLLAKLPAEKRSQILREARNVASRNSTPTKPGR